MSSLRQNETVWLPKGYRPSNQDVLCGRGKVNANHPGNRTFALMLRQNVPRYMNASKRMDKVITIATMVRSFQQTGTKFVKFDKKTNCYYELKEEQIHEKISHGIRDIIRSQNSSAAATNRGTAKTSIKATAKKHKSKATGQRESSPLPPQQEQAQEQEHEQPTPQKEQSVEGKSHHSLLSEPIRQIPTSYFQFEKEDGEQPSSSSSSSSSISSSSSSSLSNVDPNNSESLVEPNVDCNNTVPKRICQFISSSGVSAPTFATVTTTTTAAAAAAAANDDDDVQMDEYVNKSIFDEKTTAPTSERKMSGYVFDKKEYDFDEYGGGYDCESRCNGTDENDDITINSQDGDDDEHNSNIKTNNTNINTNTNTNTTNLHHQNNNNNNNTNNNNLHRSSCLQVEEMILDGFAFEIDDIDFGMLE